MLNNATTCTVLVRKNVTILDVYGVTFESLKAPKGFRFSEFRPAKLNEKYLSADGHYVNTCLTEQPEHPRLILEPLPIRLMFESCTREESLVNNCVLYRSPENKCLYWAPNLHFDARPEVRYFRLVGSSDDPQS